MTSESTVPLSEYHRLPPAQASDFYKHLLEVICNNATVALFILDEHQQCVYMNPAAEALTGYNFSEVQGRTLQEMIYPMRPDGRPYLQGECPIDHVFSENTRKQGEEVFIHKAGHFYPVAYTASPIRDGDTSGEHSSRVIGTILEAREITQEQLAAQAREAALHREQQLRAEAEAAQHQVEHLLEHMTDAFVALDREWRIVYLNTEAERINQKPRSESLGNTHWQEWPASVGTHVEHQYRRAMSEQVPVHFEHHYYAPPDYDIWLEIHAYPSEDGLGIFYRDITNRKRAEADLQSLNQQLTRRIEELQTLFDLLPIGVAIAEDPDCRRIRVNPYLSELVRIPIDANASQSAPPDERPLYRLCRDGQEMLTDNLPMQYAARHNTQVRDEVVDVIHPDGTLIKLLCYAAPLQDEQGQVRGVLGGFVDITERVLTETALRESEERLKIAQLAARAGAWNWEIASNRVIWSPEYYALYGLDPATPPSYENWLAAIWESDREQVNQQVRLVLEHRQTEISVEFRVLHPTLGIRWFNARGQTTYNSDGQPMRMSGITLDITDRKRAEAARAAAEQRFRIVGELIPFGVWEADAQGNATYLSPLFLEMTGQTLEEHRQHWQTLLHPDDIQPTVTAWEECVRTERLWEHEFRIRGKDGEYRTILARGLPVRDAQGNITSYVGMNYDMTDRKQVEEDLRLSRERLAFVLKATGIGLWLNPLPLNELNWDDQTRELFFIPPDVKPTAELFWSRVHPDDREPTRRAVEKALHERTLYEIDHRAVNPETGEIRWIRSAGKATYATDGTPIRFDGINYDISDRKHAEREREQLLQTLADERARFEAVLRQMPEGVMIAEANSGQLILSNEQANQILRHRYDLNLELEHYESIVSFQAYRPNGQPYATNEYPLVRSLQTGEVIIHEEMELRFPDGSRIFLDTNSAPIFNRQNQLVAAVAVFQNITERKQAEEDLRQALQKLNFHVENTPMSVIEWNEELRITRWSGAAERMFGWSADEVLGRFIFDLRLVFEDDIEQVTAVSRQLMEEASYVFSYNRNYTKQGDVIYCEWYNSSLRNESGQMISVLALVLDVTDRVQTERDRERILQQEQAARAEAERANRIKDEFLAIVSHELRTPLNPILGWSTLLLSRTLDPAKTTHALTTIARNAKLQAELIEDLLDVSRILRGKLSLTIVPVNLVSIVEAALETVRLSAEAKGIAVHVVVEQASRTVTEPHSDGAPSRRLAAALPSHSSSPLHVMGDPARLQQVVWNLLSNAVKFTPAAGQVEVRLERGEFSRLSAQSSHPTPPSCAQLTITDTGKGIAPDFLPHVFDYFRQEDGATTRQFGGLGLGLAIVRHLVELHGGTVEAASPGEGLGATFTVRLPLLKEDVKAQESTSPSPPRSPTPPLPLTGLSILVVDDEPDSREFVAFVLEQAGASVTTALTASEALVKLSESPPDVLLSDIGMPEMDGYQLLQQIRSLQQGQPLLAIALTAYAGEYDRQQAINAGFQQHIAKPVEPEKLVKAIAELINRQ